MSCVLNLCDYFRLFNHVFGDLSLLTKHHGIGVELCSDSSN